MGIRKQPQALYFLSLYKKHFMDFYNNLNAKVHVWVIFHYSESMNLKST